MAVFKVNIFGPILPPDYEDWYGDNMTSTNTVARQIEGVTSNDEIEFQFNSPGGSVTEGHAILTMCQNTGAKLNGNILSECASEAVYIAMGCSKLKASFHSMMMIHNVSGGAWGTQYDLDSARKAVADYDKLLCSMLAAKSGKTEEQIMQDYLHARGDVSLTMDEAKEAGFVDEIYNSPIRTGNAIVDNQATSFQALSKDEKVNFIRREILNFKTTITDTKMKNEKNVLPIVDENQMEQAIKANIETINRLTFDNSKLANEIEVEKAKLPVLENQIFEIKRNSEKELQETKTVNSSLLKEISELKNLLNKANANTAVTRAISTMRTKSGVILNEKDVKEIVDNFNKQHIFDFTLNQTLVSRIGDSGVSSVDVVTAAQTFARKDYNSYFNVSQGSGYTSDNIDTRVSKDATYESFVENLVTKKVEPNSREWVSAHVNSAYTEKVSKKQIEYYGLN